MDKTFSRSAFLQNIKVLDLKPGNVLLVMSQELLKQLQMAPAVGFDVPVLFSPRGRENVLAGNQEHLSAVIAALEIPDNPVAKVIRDQVMETFERSLQAQAAAEGMA